MVVSDKEQYIKLFQHLSLLSPFRLLLSLSPVISIGAWIFIKKGFKGYLWAWLLCVSGGTRGRVQHQHCNTYVSNNEIIKIQLSISPRIFLFSGENLARNIYICFGLPPSS